MGNAERFQEIKLQLLKQFGKEHNGVPTCPRCESTHNFFVDQTVIKTKEIQGIHQIRICDPCNEHFEWVFEFKKENNKLQVRHT